MKTCLILLPFFLCLISSQNIGTYTPEYHIPMNYSQCNSSGCTTLLGSIVLDQGWRWLHQTNGYTSCMTGSGWNTTICPDPVTCAKNCALDGVTQAQWTNTYGVLQITNGTQINFVTHGNVGSRVYLLQSVNKYKMFTLLNREFAFDVDVSTMPCGLNGGLYFVQMQSDGGSTKYPGNKAGAKYGTGYCDAQCPHTSFIWGQANTLNWTNGQGQYGLCCPQFDVWQANSQANSFAAHPCKIQGYQRCLGPTCDNSAKPAGNCASWGCGYNAYSNGNKNFYGPGSTFKVDTTKPFTVVTQFVTANNTDNGTLTQINRFYVQNGKKIANPNTNVSGLSGFSSMTDANCASQAKATGSTDYFASAGGLKSMGKSLQSGMVMSLCLWDDPSSSMLWLDSAPNGPCSASSGKWWQIQSKYPNANIKITNVKYGTIGSTVHFQADGVTVKP